MPDPALRMLRETTKAQLPSCLTARSYTIPYTDAEIVASPAT